MLNHEKDLSGRLTGCCRTRTGLSVLLTGRSSQQRQLAPGVMPFCPNVAAYAQETQSL